MAWSGLFNAALDRLSEYGTCWGLLIARKYGRFAPSLESDCLNCVPDFFAGIALIVVDLPVHHTECFQWFVSLENRE